METLKKWLSRRLGLAVGGILTIMAAALSDGVIDKLEFGGIVAAVCTAIAGFNWSDGKEKENTDAKG